MTRILILLLCLAPPAFAQEELPAPAPAAIHVAATGSAADKGAVLRHCLASNAKAVTLSEDVYELGEPPVRFQQGTTLRGPATLENSGGKFSAQACAFELSHDVKLFDLTLKVTAPRDTQSQCLGFGSRNAPTMARCEVRRCDLTGQSFCLYSWPGDRNRIIVSDTPMRAGHWVVTLGGSSGPDAAIVDLNDCQLFADWGQFGGVDASTGASAVGIAARGGRCTMVGGSITVKPHETIKRAYGVWTTVQPNTGATWGGGVWPLVVLVGVQCNSPEFDAVADIGQIVIVGGSGSGPAGEWVTKGNVLVLGAKQIRK